MDLYRVVMSSSVLALISMFAVWFLGPSPADQKWVMQSFAAVLILLSVPILGSSLLGAAGRNARERLAFKAYGLLAVVLMLLGMLTLWNPYLVNTYTADNLYILVGLGFLLIGLFSWHRDARIH